MCSVKIFDYKINADLNKNVFNLDLKITKEGLSRISKGKLFYSFWSRMLKRSLSVSLQLSSWMTWGN